MKHLLVAAILSGILVGALRARAVDAPACTARGPLPDASPGCTPGKVDSNRTPELICSTSTRTVRPPVEVTNRIKYERMAAYGVVDADPRMVELDHLVPLALGGDPASLDNLWPQYWQRADGWDAHRKDALELHLYRLVCAGQIDLAEAQQAIASDWVTAYETYLSH